MNSCYWGLRLQNFYNHLTDLIMLWLFLLNFHENTLKTFPHMFIHLCFWTELMVSIPYHLLNLSRKLKATNFFKSSSLRTTIFIVLAKSTFKVNLNNGNIVSDHKQVCYTHCLISAIYLVQQSYNYLASFKNCTYRWRYRISS